MAGQVAPLTSSEQTLAAAAAAFLAQPSLARSTHCSYDQTLTRLVGELGSDRLLSTLTVEAVTLAVTTAWGGRAPATWNRQVATVRSFLGFCRRRRWLVEDLTVDLERRPEPADRTKAIPIPELERLWRREDIGVREKALWRLLYETAARASEALAINVEDLELDNKRVRVRSKGGDIDWLHFQTGSARLLPRLIGGRTRGPLFLADRRPVPARAPATVDRCPETGRGRLSYRRAEGALRARNVSAPAPGSFVCRLFFAHSPRTRGSAGPVRCRHGHARRRSARGLLHRRCRFLFRRCPRRQR